MCMLLDLRSRILDQISSREIVKMDGDGDKVKGIFRYIQQGKAKEKGAGGRGG